MRRYPQEDPTMNRIFVPVGLLVLKGAVMPVMCLRGIWFMFGQEP